MLSSACVVVLMGIVHPAERDELPPPGAGVADAAAAVRKICARTILLGGRTWMRRACFLASGNVSGAEARAQYRLGAAAHPALAALLQKRLRASARRNTKLISRGLMIKNANTAAS